MEIWKNIPKYENYKISNFGNVKRLARKIIKKGTNKTVIISEKLLNQRNSKGYQVVSLRNCDGRKTLKVHRLVLLTFKPNKNECLQQCNHIDGNKRNNHLDNLEWCTPSQNKKHAFKIGLQKPVIGENHGMAKLKSNDISEIRELYKTNKYYQKQIAEMFGISQQQVSNIVSYKKWSWL